MSRRFWACWPGWSKIAGETERSQCDSPVGASRQIINPGKAAITVDDVPIHVVSFHSIKAVFNQLLHLFGMADVISQQRKTVGRIIDNCITIRPCLVFLHAEMSGKMNESVDAGFKMV